jgi:hypothetical protein
VLDTQAGDLALYKRAIGSGDGAERPPVIFEVTLEAVAPLQVQVDLFLTLERVGCVPGRALPSDRLRAGRGNIGGVGAGRQVHQMPE